MAGYGFRQRIEQRAAIDDALAAWLRPQVAAAIAADSIRAGIPAAALANAVDLVNSAHLKQRGFGDSHGAGAIPGLPWHAIPAAPRAGAETGADTDRVLSEVLGSPNEIAAPRNCGAFG